VEQASKTAGSAVVRLSSYTTRYGNRAERTPARRDATCLSATKVRRRLIQANL